MESTSVEHSTTSHPKELVKVTSTEVICTNDSTKDSTKVSMKVTSTKAFTKALMEVTFTKSSTKAFMDVTFTKAYTEASREVPSRTSTEAFVTSRKLS